MLIAMIINRTTNLPIYTTADKDAFEVVERLADRLVALNVLDTEGHEVNAADKSTDANPYHALLEAGNRAVLDDTGTSTTIQNYLIIFASEGLEVTAPAVFIGHDADGFAIYRGENLIG